jgi:toxin secretion/phage lysis holin
MKGIFQTVVAVLGSWLTYLFGGWSALLGILLAFVVTDYITGILAAGSKGELSSAVGMRGIAKKICIFVLVAIAHLGDRALGDGTLIRDAAIYFYLANELLSITENIGILGVPIPGVIQKAVEILKGKSDPQNGG